MDMKAFRADLQQKSFNARKTNNYEDRINVTYKGMVSENSEEYYKELSENLEKSVNFLSGLLRAAEYQSINVGIQNALRGRSNNVYEEYVPPVYAPFTPGQGYVPPPAPPTPPPPPPPPAPEPAPSAPPPPDVIPTYDWPTPPLMGEGTGAPDPSEYFPEGLTPTQGPNKDDYPKTKDGVQTYLRDKARWESARKLYYHRLRNQTKPNPRPQTPRKGGGYYPAGN